tara:strand:+ start:2307 stop:3674 length:1368 start_codon:yes stop_codon:yes gene_type:complete
MSEPSRTRPRTRNLLATAGLLAVGAMLVGPLAAETRVARQIPGTIQPGAQDPGTPNPATQPGLQNPGSAPSNLPGQLLNGGGAQGGAQGGPDEFSSIWSVPSAPTFQGFPTFPARLPGYGNYPLPVNPTTGASPIGTGDGNPLVLPLAPAEPEPAGWPTWIRTQAKKPLPFAVELGLLVSQNGRVWHRDRAADPFEPILFHDKFASLPIGAQVETRGAASFEVLLHQSTRIEARGLTAMQVVSLDEQLVHIAFREITWLRLSASGRTNRFTLPDGSSIEFAAAAPPVQDLAAIFGGVATPSDMPRQPSIEIRRTDEPGWYGGRATMTNFGGNDIVWTHAFGKTIIPPEHRVTLFLSPPAAPTSAGLQPGETRVERAEERVTCRSDMATEVQWCGAKIQLPKGAKVTFESLGGSFVEQTKAVPPASSPATEPTPAEPTPAGTPAIGTKAAATGTGG